VGSGNIESQQNTRQECFLCLTHGSLVDKKAMVYEEISEGSHDIVLSLIDVSGRRCPPGNSDDKTAPLGGNKYVFKEYGGLLKVPKR
jgi:hypothetical protein